MLQKVFLGVRIPPPPYKNGLSYLRPVFILCGEDEKHIYVGCVSELRLERFCLKR